MNIKDMEGILSEFAKLHYEIIHLKQLNREMVEVLKEVEWAETWDDYIDGPLFSCPVCGNVDTKGHNKDCQLQIILAKADGRVESK